MRSSFLRGSQEMLLSIARVDRARWLDEVANVRLHGTTQRRPVDFFAAEKPELRPLPADVYEVAVWGLYRVRKDCHIHVKGNHYSVPWCLVGQKVLVSLSETHVSVLAGEERVAHNLRALGKGEDVTDTPHYPVAKCEATQEIQRRRCLAIR